jgi:hypothetical protein
MVQAVSHRFPTVVLASFDPRSDHIGVVARNVAMGQVFFFSEGFGFPRQFSFHQLLHIYKPSYCLCCRP